MVEEEKTEYFYKLVYLVYDLGTERVRDVFKKHIPEEQSIEEYLISQKSRIEQNKSLFNPMQFGIVTAEPPKVDELDISLLFKLIRNFTSIQEPTLSWETDRPLLSDKSPGANLVRLKSVRNGVIAHRSRGRLTQSEFEKHWKDTKAVLLGLAGYVSQTVKNAVERKIDEVKTKLPVDQPQIEDRLVKLMKWYFEDLGKKYNDLEIRLEKIENKVSEEKLQEAINSLKASIGEILEQVKMVGLKVGSTSAGHGRSSTSETDGIKMDLEQIRRLLHLGGFTEQPIEPPSDNPNALSDEEIEEYSGKLGKDPCRDWEIFGVLLGYLQAQLDELQKVYRNMMQKGYYVMLQKWNYEVAKCDENPRKLVAAAFIGIHDDKTAEEILGPAELEGVKNLAPKPETERRIQNMKF